MANIQEIVGSPAPRSIWRTPWPVREDYHPSPVDWRREVIYFLLPDRFSDDRDDRPPLERADLWAARPNWRWDKWSESGRARFQGGTIPGITSRLDYLSDLGVTALWIAPVWKQRAVTGIEGGPPEADDYHGYAIQDFLDVDPRFGTRENLVELVRQAHARGIRVILDIVVNHTAECWDYASDVIRPPYQKDRYSFGAWRDGTGGRLAPGQHPQTPEQGVWPSELHDSEGYTRAGGDGSGWGGGNIDDPGADFRRADWFNRDLDLSRGLETIIRIWTYWVALLDVDGVRVDTLKHITIEQARLFCGAMREFADGLGKANFLILGEVAGGDWLQERYLDLVGRDLSAVLETGETRGILRAVAAGARDPDDFFSRFHRIKGMPHRAIGSVYGTSLDDHDNVDIAPQVRFGADPPHPEQVILGVAMVLFTLGIPTLYYGTEQALTGPEPSEREWLHPSWGTRDKSGDRHLREAMFGAEHARKAGAAGVPGAGVDPGDPGLFDADVPGFGPFGTSGHHVFDRDGRVFQQVRMMLKARSEHPALSVGRQYLRRVATTGAYALPLAGDVVAWSRILANTEAVCVINPSLTESRTVRVEIDGPLHAGTTALTVIANSAEVDGPAKHPVGSAVEVRPGPDFSHHVELPDLPPASVLVLTG
ncbi:alpha-amylase family glycosyl hydrolase [Nonomuraea sp. NPDC050790]|uniref:alpha-amylase family glycosyl hydrolase n=1 Tax=Nonomuraea sp. NPDC050790 TaxID=3364371 RepID=UPI0037885C35